MNAVAFALVTFCLMVVCGFAALGVIVHIETLADQRDCAAIAGTRFDFMHRACWTSDGRRVFIDGNSLL